MRATSAIFSSATWIQSSPRKLECSSSIAPSLSTTFCSSGESSGRGGGGVWFSSAGLIGARHGAFGTSGQVVGVVLGAQETGAGVKARFGHQQIGFVPERSGARIGGNFDLPAHHDRLFRTRLFAKAAKHA